MSGQNPESLRAFQTWFFSPAGPGIGRIPLCEPTHQKDGITALTLYRRNGYQAELALVPTGQDYEICLPEGMDLGFVFLGGGFYYGTPLPEEEALRAAQRTAHNEYQEEISQIMARPDYLEHPHPLRNANQSPPFFPLAGGKRIAFSATGQTGIILLLGRYETDKAHSWLEHITLPSPVPCSTEITP